MASRPEKDQRLLRILRIKLVSGTAMAIALGISASPASLEKTPLAKRNCSTEFEILKADEDSDAISFLEMKDGKYGFDLFEIAFQGKIDGVDLIRINGIQQKLNARNQLILSETNPCKSGKFEGAKTQVFELPEFLPHQFIIENGRVESARAFHYQFNLSADRDGAVGSQGEVVRNEGLLAFHQRMQKSWDHYEIHRKSAEIFELTASKKTSDGETRLRVDFRKVDLSDTERKSYFLHQLSTFFD